MFTRCPECLTVFHISAAELRAADGAVVCGECDAKFDALASLSETPPTESPKAPVAPPTDSEQAAEPSPAGDESGARDEEDFLEELESLIGPEETAAADQTEAEPEAQEDWEPEDELDQAVEEDWEDHVGVEPSPWAEDDLEADAEPLSAADERPHGTDRVEPALVDSDGGGEEQQGREGDEAGTAGEERAADRAGEPDEPYVGDDTLEPAELRELAALQPRRRRWPAVIVALLAVIVLAGAWAHSQRGALLRHPMGAAVLGPFYSVLGLEATARWRPADFQALKWEAEADPASPERLIVAVEFVNSADFAQPYPMLRVVLEDRFGRRVGSHDVVPADYLEGYSRGRRLPAGARVRAMVEVPDPGARAEGFRIDFCLESGAQGLVCSNDAPR